MPSLVVSYGIPSGADTIHPALFHVDDFAILWTKRKSIDHFIATLRQLYSVKINWEGTKYIGMNIDINRKERHVTLSMAGYIDKLYKRFDLK